MNFIEGLKKTQNVCGAHPSRFDLRVAALVARAGRRRASITTRTNTGSAGTNANIITGTGNKTNTGISTNTNTGTSINNGNSHNTTTNNRATY